MEKERATLIIVPYRRKKPEELSPIRRFWHWLTGRPAIDAPVVPAKIRLLPMVPHEDYIDIGDRVRKKLKAIEIPNIFVKEKLKLVGEYAVRKKSIEMIAEMLVGNMVPPETLPGEKELLIKEAAQGVAELLRERLGDQYNLNKIANVIELLEILEKSPDAHVYLHARIGMALAKKHGTVAIHLPEGFLRKVKEETFKEIEKLAKEQGIRLVTYHPL